MNADDGELAKHWIWRALNPYAWWIRESTPLNNYNQLQTKAVSPVYTLWKKQEEHLDFKDLNIAQAEKGS